MDNPFAQPARHDDRRGDETCRWESGFKLDIPEFHGSLTPNEFLDWLVSVEEVLGFKEVPSDRRVALVSTRLRGRATAWWQQTKITQWDKFTKQLRAKFMPFNYARTLYKKLQNLRLGSRTVD